MICRLLQCINISKCQLYRHIFKVSFPVPRILPSAKYWWVCRSGKDFLYVDMYIQFFDSLICLNLIKNHRLYIITALFSREGNAFVYLLNLMSRITNYLHRSAHIGVATVHCYQRNVEATRHSMFFSQVK